MSHSRFPRFDDGDVVIGLPGGRLYLLHTAVLRRNSAYFSDLLDEDLGAKLTTKARKEGVNVRYRVDLIIDGRAPGSSNARFILKEVDSNGRSVGNVGFSDIDNGKVPNPVYKHYDNLFRGIYNESIDINNADLASVLEDCMGLLNVAENYASVPCVAESIDIALLRQGQVLFKSIAQNPVAWANLAIRIKSPTVMKDCLIHLVGKWRMLSEREKNDLDTGIMGICQRKYDELRKTKSAIDLRILGHYSNNIQKPIHENPGRMSYGNDIYSWMALSLFRHWFCQSMCENKTFDADDGGFRFYLAMYRGGQAYLDRAQCEDFHIYFPMSRKGKTVFENHLAAYKADIQSFAAPLLINRAQLELADDEQLGYLTCLEVETKDYPWVLH